MGLASALSTALTGLNASEKTIDVVGNNIANANTVGFKASKAIFATQFLQTSSLGSGPSGTSGGTNPRQTGLGTKIAEITPDFTQGTIQISSNPSDLAIQGDGFFIVEGGQGEQLYTRNGILKTNAQNELVTISGQRLLGQGVDENFQIQSTTLQPLVIPLGSAAVAQATKNVFFQGDLTPTGDVATTPEVIESAVLSDGSKEVPPALPPASLAGIAPPLTTSSTATASASAGAIPAGTYRYKVTFVQADGQESSPSVDIGPITTTGTAGLDQSIDLNNLPALATGFVSRNIYRTDGTGTGAYKLVGTTAAGATFTDTTAVGGATLDQSSLAQGTYSYYVTFHNSATGLESRPSPLVGPQSITVDGRRLSLTNIPSPTSPEFNEIRIYRSLSDNNGTAHFLLATLPSGTTNYMDGASDASINIAANKINLDGPPISPGLLLTDVVQRQGSNYVHPFEVGTLRFTGQKGGRQLTEKSLQITPTTTIAEFLDFVKQSTGIQDATADPTHPIAGNPGGSIDTGESRLRIESNAGVDNAIDIGLSSMELDTASGTRQLSLGFGSTQTAVGESAVSDFVVYDALGIQLNVRVTVVLEAKDDVSTTYRWFADSGANDPATGAGIAVGTGQIIFDGNGNVSSVTNSTVDVARDHVASTSPLEFDLDFSQLSGLAQNKSTLAATRQDGSGPGTLSSYIIGEDGTIRGVFSNGVTRTLGQVIMAKFANNAGLEQRGENLFAAGVNSGLPVQGRPGEQGIGQIIAGATELSNTDIGQNLIDLITASTQYRGGSRVITAVQQLLDELMNLRR